MMRSRQPPDQRGIAVVIPTRGESPFLREALDSVLADAADAEIVVVEDGTSLVDEGAISPARLIRLPYVGRSVARNTGVAETSAPFVAFLDADDISLPGRLERQREALDASPGATLVFGRVEAIDAESRPLPDDNAIEEERFAGLLRRGATYESLLVDCPIFTSATAVRRDRFLSVGGYDFELDAYEDLDLYLRLAGEDGLVPCVGPPVASHRRHGRNTSSDYLYAGALRLAEKHLLVARGRSRRLLLERELDCLWGLGDLPGARRHAVRALAEQPPLIANPRFAKRLLGSVLPRPVAELIRVLFL